MMWIAMDSKDWTTISPHGCLLIEICSPANVQEFSKE
jgi:hypothetical protein